MVREEGVMVKVALYVQLEAKPGKESEVESFLKGGVVQSLGLKVLVAAAGKKSAKRRKS